MIKKQLKKYEKFLESYNFNFQELVATGDSLYWNDIEVYNKENSVVSETDKFVNVAFKAVGGILPRMLSNLFPYEFVFKGKKVKSLESVFQGIKFKDKKHQNYVLNYAGIESNYVKIATDYNWKITGIVYWQGKPINRHSKEYKTFVNELYISAIKNPLYYQILKQVKDRYVFHTIGETDPSNTVFTRYEFEKQLNSLVEFLK